MLQIDTVPKKDGCYFYFRGSIRDDTSLEIFSDFIENLNLKEEYTSITWDFKELILVNSSGIGKLICFNEEMKKKGKQLILVNIREQLLQIFKFAKVLDDLYISE